tara:strand:- start:1179 stop:1391 length:213 start_codon:yes stop_codon:yes gene_type:complete
MSWETFPRRPASATENANRVRTRRAPPRSVIEVKAGDEPSVFSDAHEGESGQLAKALRQLPSVRLREANP